MVLSINDSVISFFALTRLSHSKIDPEADGERERGMEKGGETWLVEYGKGAEPWTPSGQDRGHSTDSPLFSKHLW